MIVNLKVRDVTAHIRGDDPARPVHVGYDGSRVVMLLDADHADFLARLLANVESNPNSPRAGWLHQVDKTTQDTWLHAMVDLLAARAMTTGLPAPITLAEPVGVTR